MSWRDGSGGDLRQTCGQYRTGRCGRHVLPVVEPPEGAQSVDGADARRAFVIAAPGSRVGNTCGLGGTEIEQRDGEAVGKAPQPVACGEQAPAMAAGEAKGCEAGQQDQRSEEHTSELQSLMRISYAVFCLKKKKKTRNHT